VDNFEEVVEKNVGINIIIAFFGTFQRSQQATINMGQASIKLYCKWTLN
jgi:hypothetical protein